MENRLNFADVLSEGIGIGLKNAPSLLGAVVLWLLTIWIPYLNVGTTIAICSIPVALSEGKVISPLFIFDKGYRTIMGEYFMLVGLMAMALIPALAFLVVPAIVIGLAWSLAVFILIDRQVSPTEAIIQSNRATLGHKWTIFLVLLVLSAAASIVSWIFGKIPHVGWVLSLCVTIVLMVAQLGCNAVIYRKLVKEVGTPAAE